MVFALRDIRTKSGQREVAATSCGKTSFLFKSPLNCQSEATCKMLSRGFITVPVLQGFAPCLTKVIPFDGWACVLLLAALTRTCSTHFAISARTLSCLHLYHPSANTFGQSSAPGRRVRRLSPGALTLPSRGLCTTMAVLALASALLHLFPGSCPRPSHPLHTTATISCCFQWDSASVMACCGFHFCLHLMAPPECSTFPSLDDISVLTAPALVTLNSSTTDVDSLLESTHINNIVTILKRKQQVEQRENVE